MANNIPHGVVEDWALKRVLHPNDFHKGVAIPRAQVKSFPTNVSNFKRSASARHPPRQGQQGQAQRPEPLKRQNSFRTKPIDIALLMADNPAKPPVTRGLGRSYSSAENQQRNQNQRRAPPLSNGNMPQNGGNSFLFSGNYDASSPVAPVISKPVPPPLKRTQSLNHKHPGHFQGNGPPAPKMAANRNPLVASKEPAGLSRIDEGVGVSQNGNFDNWADEMYNRNSRNGNSKKPETFQAPANKNSPVTRPGFGPPPIGPDNRPIFEKPQRNWALLSSAATTLPEPDRNNNIFGNDSDDDDDMLEEEETFADMAKEVAKEEAIGAVKDFLSNGEFNPADLAEGLAGGIGGKVGGKIGGKIGAKLGNEELGEKVGEQGGELAGELAGDAVGDLIGGEVPELDPEALCSKCTIL